MLPVDPNIDCWLVDNWNPRESVIKTAGIRENRRPIPHIPIEILIPGTEPDRIFAQPTADTWVIPSCSVVALSGFFESRVHLVLI